MDFERYVTEIERGRARAATAGAHGPENLVVLARTVSTNLLARGVAADYETEGLDLTPMLVLALEQSGGRGRQGRSWSSPRGQGVYATLARPYGQKELLPALPLLVGLGLCRALAPHLPHGCRLKWPNDLVVPHGLESAVGADADEAARRGDRTNGTLGAARASRASKIGGILIEALVHPGDACVALIGFGVNHGQRLEELPPGATSLLLETGGHLGSGRGIGLAELTWELVAGVERELAHVGDLPYAVAAYRELIIHRPGEWLVCKVGEREVAGAFAGIDDAGRLRLRPAAVGAAPGAGAGARAEDGGEDGAEVVVLSAGEVVER
ncbi:MAG TPA: biotin--[acetyl-CoA-carboxylase] ligase [Thermoanaerobaculia bacterium]|nr:biotin--[acetyl-CoA-carboxylase] ligase [Thermoanaerobaculia bacterium]